MNDTDKYNYDTAQPSQKQYHINANQGQELKIAQTHEEVPYGLCEDDITNLYYR